jgi:putative transposase
MRDRIVRLGRQLGLRCKHKHKFAATTNSRHGFPLAESLVIRHSPIWSNEAWMTDICYVMNDKDRLSLTEVKDVYAHSWWVVRRTHR